MKMCDLVDGVLAFAANAGTHSAKHMTSVRTKPVNFFVMIVYLFSFVVKDMHVDMKQISLLAFLPNSQ
ncbi:hypothetical protein OBV_15380 [Oscillibacter valericigenes Sjm18-20]|nr:hypothetical protein OBV_15380 [Oscillibacter valericigenes Sjm18-20]